MEYIKQWKEGMRIKENGKMYTRKSVALWTPAHVRTRTHTHTHTHTNFETNYGSKAPH